MGVSPVIVKVKSAYKPISGPSSPELILVSVA